MHQTEAYFHPLGEICGPEISMKQDWSSYLIEVLREDVVSCEAEIQALRSGLRFRVGGWILEALPPGPKTIGVFLRLLRLYLKRRGGPPATTHEDKAPGLDDAARRASVVVFGSGMPDSDEDVWQTEDADLVARRLDLGGDGAVLVIRTPAQQVLRRLVRAQQAGWHVIWYPESESLEADPALVAYARAHADECREADFT